jgi:hypothetical protein
VTDKHAGEHGSMLLISLMTLTAVSILMIAVFGITRAMARESLFQERLAQARAIAEAGMEDALLQLRLNPNWNAGLSNKPFAGGSYSVTLSTHTPPWLTANGVAPSLTFFGAANVNVRSRAQIQLSTSATDCTTYSGYDTQVNGTLDSYDSSVSASPTTFGFGGHYCSNRKFGVVDNTLRVRMDVDYFTIPAPPVSSIQGALVKSTFTRVLPAYDGTPYVSSNNNASLPPAYYTSGTKKLSVPTNISVTMSSGIYYLNGLTLNGNLRADTSTGQVVIYLNSNFTLSNLAGSGNGEITNVSKIPSRLAIYPQGSRTLSLNSKAPLYAVLYGAKSTFTVNQELYGNWVGYQVTLSASRCFHFDVQTTGNRTVKRATWQPGSWSSN